MLTIYRYFQTMPGALVDAVQRLRRHEIQPLASSLAFTTAVSLVPLLAVSLSVFTLLGGLEQLLEKVEPLLLENLVSGAGKDVAQTIRRSIQRVHSGTLGMGGLLGLLLASTKLFHDMERAVLRVWQVRPTRALWARLLIYWGVMFLGPLVLAVIIGLISSKDLDLIRYVPKSTISFLFSLISLFCIYKFVPSVPVRKGVAFLSAFAAASGILLAQKVYAALMQQFFFYNKVYGSLAAIPLLLIWILWLWWICLGGAAFASAWQKRLS